MYAIASLRSSPLKEAFPPFAGMAMGEPGVWKPRSACCRSKSSDFASGPSPRVRSGVPGIEPLPLGGVFALVFMRVKIAHRGFSPLTWINHDRFSLGRSGEWSGGTAQVTLYTGTARRTFLKKVSCGPTKATESRTSSAVAAAMQISPLAPRSHSRAAALVTVPEAV